MLCGGPALHRHRAGDVAPWRLVTEYLHFCGTKSRRFFWVSILFWVSFHLNFLGLKLPFSIFFISSFSSNIQTAAWFLEDPGITWSLAIRAGPAAAWVKALDDLLEVCCEVLWDSWDEIDIERGWH